MRRDCAWRLRTAPTCPTAARYNPKTHSWYHPKARAAQDMLLLGQGPANCRATHVILTLLKAGVAQLLFQPQFGVQAVSNTFFLPPSMKPMDS